MLCGSVSISYSPASEKRAARSRDLNEGAVRSKYERRRTRWDWKLRFPVEVMNRERRADESIDACLTRSPKTREVRWGRVGVTGGRTLGKESMKDRKVRVDVSLRVNDEELIIEPGSMSKMMNCDNSGSYL